MKTICKWLINAGWNHSAIPRLEAAYQLHATTVLCGKTNADIILLLLNICTDSVTTYKTETA